MDPLFEAGGLLTGSGAALTGSEARTAFLFLELQWHNETAGKGLTKSSFDALVRGALNGTNNSQRINRTEIHNRIGKFLPQHDISKLVPYIDGSLRRLTKSAIRHWEKEGEFCLAHEEIERLRDVAAEIRLLNDSFEADISDTVNDIENVPISKRDQIAKLIRTIIENYFLRSGEEFAVSLTQDIDPPYQR